MALVDNILAYYKLDESSGNPADSSGNGYTLVNTGTATFGTGKINNGIVLNGSNQYAFSTNSDLNLSTDTWSVSAWFKLDAVTANSQTVVSSKLTSGLFGELFKIIVGDGGGTDKTSIRFVTWASSGSFLVIDSGVDASADTWYHAVIVKAADNDWKFYVNAGTPESSTANRNRDTNALNGVSIGASDLGSDGVSSYLDGVIDEVAIWTRALSSGEVASIYNSGNGLQYPFTIAYNLQTEVGFYSLTGKDASFKRAIKMTPQVGTYSITGFPINLRFAIQYVMQALTGYYNIIGGSINRFKNDPKPTTTYSNDTKPSTNYTNDSKPL
jgi:hypothetical protein